MNKAEIIKGINTVIEGLEEIKKAFGEAEGVEAPKKSKSVARREEVQTADEAPVITGKFDEEELKSMKYNEFKKLAASLGVKCTGTRDEIMERILALDVTVEADAEEEVADEAPAKGKKADKSDKPAKGKKLGKKEADEPARDEFDEQAEEIAKETDVADIISALADVDIKATKKNAVEKLAQALREGLIEMDDEDEDEVTDDVEDESEDVEDEEDDDEEEEISAESYFSEYDPEGYNDPSNMTKKRAKAIKAKMEEIIEGIEDETITSADIESYLEDNATDDELELLGEDYEDDDLIKMYMEMVKRTIDNDGEEHEPSDPYEVGDKDVCCSHTLKYVKKTKKYVCSQCGNEYEAE